MSVLTLPAAGCWLRPCYRSPGIGRCPFAALPGPPSYPLGCSTFLLTFLESSGLPTAQRVTHQPHPPCRSQRGQCQPDASLRAPPAWPRVWSLLTWQPAGVLQVSLARSTHQLAIWFITKVSICCDLMQNARCLVKKHVSLRRVFCRRESFPKWGRYGDPRHSILALAAVIYSPH